MQRFGYSDEHEQFRRTARAFFDKELEPHYKSYVAKGGLDKEFWRKAGKAGLLGLCIPEELGGPGGVGANPGFKGLLLRVERVVV